MRINVLISMQEYGCVCVLMCEGRVKEGEERE